MHWTPTTEEQTVEGVLFYDEGDDKYNKAKSNTNQYSDIRINLSELLAKTDLVNKDFASRIYLKSISLTLDDKIE